MADGALPVFDPREDEIRALIKDELNIAEIAKLRGVKRQAIWEFCARRGWLGDDSLKKIEEKDARRRENRRLPPPPPAQVGRSVKRKAAAAEARTANAKARAAVAAKATKEKAAAKKAASKAQAKNYEPV